MTLLKFFLILISLAFFAGCQSNPDKPKILSGYEIKPGSEASKRLELDEVIRDEIWEEIKNEGIKRNDLYPVYVKTVSSHTEPDGHEVKIEWWTFEIAPLYKWKVFIIKDRKGTFTYEIERFLRENPKK